MKKIKCFLNLLLIICLLNSVAFAGTDLSQNARKLGSIVDSFGIVVVGVFMSIAGLYVASGSQEGMRKFSLGVIGTIIFICSGAIITALKVLK
jgi:hypothetical protein